MTVEVTTSWLGGALGTNPTVTTEPVFSAQGGTVANAVYSPAIGGEAGQAIRVSGTRDFTLPLSGNHWRVGARIARVAGTQTLGQAALLFRAGATNVADVFLRNQNGGQWALRQGTGGSLYAGQSTLSTANGEQPWRVEVEYLSDGTTHEITLYLFEPGNTTGTPRDTFKGTVTAPITNMRIGNPTGATGVTLDMGQILLEPTGAPIWVSPDQPGTLTFLSGFWADQTNAVVVGKVADAETVGVTIGDQTVATTPDSAGYFRAQVTGLTPGARVNWQVKVDDTVRREGTMATTPSVLNGMRILFGSCFDTVTSAFFTKAAAYSPNLIVSLGDYGYPYITGGPNGNTSPTDIATCRLNREPVLSAAAPQALVTTYPMSYTMSDCDGGGANSDGTTGGLATGAVQGAYRQQFAHPDLPLTRSGARAWRIGKVRFIQTDETVDASAKAMPDGYRDNPTPEQPSVPNPDKTKLGIEQKAWFKDQIDQAAAAGESVVWFGDGPWIEPTQITGNSWRAYPTERAEIGAYIQASGVKLVRLHGDTHTLFCDDGTNNPWGRFPTASAAPWHTTAQPFSYPVTGGLPADVEHPGRVPSYPSATTNSSIQIGIADFADDGTNVTLTVRGMSSTVSQPTEVERYRMLVDLTPGGTDPGQPWATVYLGNQEAEAVYIGSEQIWP